MKREGSFNIAVVTFLMISPYYISNEYHHTIDIILLRQVRLKMNLRAEMF